MTHQVVAIGDVHLRAGHSRNAARLKALDDIIAEGLALPNLGAWLQLGDVFDGKSSVADRNDLAPRLQRMANAAPVLITSGNHDVPGDLDVFGRLEAHHTIRVYKGPDVVRIVMASGATLAAALIPYPSKGGLIAAGSSADETLQTGGDCLNDVLRDLGASLADERASGRPAIVAGHLNIGGALTSSGQPSIGREIEIAPAALRLLGDVPIVFGHIHAPQEIGGAFYAGSITANNWGEREAKRFLIVEFDDAALTYTVSSRPIDTAPMVHVDGRLTRDGFASDSPDDLPASWLGAEVRVRYSFAASERNVLDHSLVRIPFEGALRLEVEPVAVPDRALRAPEVAAARTLAEKVRAWAGLTGAAVTDGILAKLAALEHGDATGVLSTVANQVAALETAENVERAA